MILYIGITVFTVFLAYFIKNHDVVRGTRQYYLNRVCMLTVFCTLFLVSACRYKVGNDYKRYLEFFRLIDKGQYVPTEKGFNIIVHAMQTIFGSEIYLSIFAFFAFVTLLFLLKGIYNLSENFFFSFFLFMCFSYYFQSMNTVRYYLAVALAMLSMKYVLKKQYVQFTALILLASLMHKSVLVVIPIYLIAGCPWRKWFTALLTAGIVSALLFQDLYMKIILFLYPTYENTELLDGGTSVTNIVRCGVILLFTLIYYRSTVKDNAQIRFYFHLNYIAFLLYSCCSFLPEISRIGYYLTIGQIFLLPMVIARIPGERQKKFCKYAVATAAVIYFIAFLYTAYFPLIKLLPYRTWFFEPRFAFTE